MARYRFKVNTPWGKKGRTCPEVLDVCFAVHDTFAASPSDYPDLCEPIPETGPVQVVANWLRKNHTEWSQRPVDVDPNWEEYAATRLLGAGLDPSKLDPVNTRIYPCLKCDKMRTKEEGGTTFSVCDDCWHKE